MKQILSFLVVVVLVVINVQCTPVYRSQYGQDTFVHQKFFADKKNGVFVDIGAHDGLRYSNTYFFEKFLGWKGICVEPIPSVFEALQNNRNCICVNGCIDAATGTQKFLQIHGYSEMLSGLLDQYDTRHMDRIEKELKQYGGSKEVIPVTCYTLNDLCDQYDLDHIDYLSIDTEGNELHILESIDFGRITIDVIDVENNYKTPRIKQLLESYGYRLIKRIDVDEIYKKKSNNCLHFFKSSQKIYLLQGI